MLVNIYINIHTRSMHGITVTVKGNEPDQPSLNPG